MPQYNQMRGPGGYPATPYMQGAYSGPGGQSMHGGAMDGTDMGVPATGGYAGSSNGGSGRGGRGGRGGRRGGRKGGRGQGGARGGYNANANYNTNGGGYQNQYHQGMPSDQSPEPQSKGEASS